jgi:hypothetical protein
MWSVTHYSAAARDAQTGGHENTVAFDDGFCFRSKTLSLP